MYPLTALPYIAWKFMECKKGLRKNAAAWGSGRGYHFVSDVNV